MSKLPEMCPHIADICTAETKEKQSGITIYRQQTADLLSPVFFGKRYRSRRSGTFWGAASKWMTFASIGKGVGACLDVDKTCKLAVSAV